MPRILAIDYGFKRSGIAVTDSSQIIASALETIPSDTLIDYLRNYFQQEEVESIVIGMPKNLDGTSTHGTIHVEKIVDKLKNQFPDKPIYLHDERFTSKMAAQSMIAGGMKKKTDVSKEILIKSVL